MINRLCTMFSALSSMLTLAMIAFVASPAFAQAEDLRPPKTNSAISSPKFLIMGVIVLLLAATVVVVTLKAKRGHQD